MSSRRFFCLLTFATQIQANPSAQQDAGQKPQIVTCPPDQFSAQHDDSMSAAPNDFTLNTQTPTRAANSRTYAPSSLRSIKSSPIHPSAKDEPLPSRSMHHSFFGFEHDGAGDTQPMDTQTFKEHSDFGSSRIGLGGLASVAEGERLVIDDSEVVAQDQQKMDLTDDDDENDGQDLEDFDDVSSLNRTDELSPNALSRVQAQTAALFKQPALPPRTPLNPGTKRKRSHDTTTPDIRTSSTKGNATIVRNMFGAQAGLPNLGNMSQLFKHTQPGSSPAPGAPHSDSPFNRPSPSMFVGQLSTRDYSMSSPVRPSTSDGLPSGPLNQYRRMDESQESRARREAHAQTLQRNDTLDEDDFTFDSLPSQTRRTIEEKSRKAAISNIELSTSKTLYDSPKASRSKSVDHLSSDRFIRTPATRLSRPRPLSPDPVSDPAEQVDLPDTVREEDMDDLGPGGVQVPMTSSKPVKQSQSGMSQVPSPSSSQHSADAPTHTQMTVAVQDSQGDRQANASHIELNGRKMESSAVSAHRIQQSQYTELTSEARLVTSQHIRQQAEQAEEVTAPDELPQTMLIDIIPSSPPIEFSEHDNEYNGDSDVEVLEGHEDEEMIDAGLGEADKEAGVEGHVDEDVDDGAMDVDAPDHEEEGEEIDFVEEHPVANARLDRPSTPDPDVDEAALKLMAGARSTSLVPPEVDTGEDSRVRVIAISTGTEVFNTAETHQTPSHSRVRPEAQSQSESQVSPIKRLQDITHTVSPRRSGASFGSQDLNAVMDNMFTGTDHAYLDIIEKTSDSPRRKRMRTYKDRSNVLRETSANVNLPKARKGAKVAFAAEEVVQPAPAETSSEMEPAQSAPIADVEPTMQETSDSTMEREAEGAKAALEARRLVAKRRVAPPKATKQSRKKSLSIKREPVKRPIDASESLHDDNVQLETVDEGTELPTPRTESVDDNRLIESPLPPTSSGVRQYLPAATSATSEPTPSAHKVLALFKGNLAYWYPAIYMETLFSDPEKCKVRFCDGTVAVVEIAKTRCLELKVNDCVKVDVAGMRKGTYLVQGFEEQAESSFTDALDHKALKLAPRNAEGVAATQEPVIVPIEQIYVTGNMLPTFADRKFVPPTREPERFSTPALAGTSEPTTPGSRSRRQQFGASVTGAVPKQEFSSGLFSNMAFAITFVENGDQAKRTRDAIAKDIAANGGSVLESGFEELFDTSATQPPSPRKSPGKSTPSVVSNEESLRLLPIAKNLGFSAVIADRHCRTKKYLQALALGIPCLHHRWISDCMAQSATLPFDTYLLPAGESEYLGGAIRSRVLPSYAPESDQAHLKQVVDQRSVPFSGSSVLLIMNSADKRKAYSFLASAAGATTVRCVPNLNEARKAMQDTNVCYDLALIDGDKGKAKDVLLGGKKQETNKKKRKRESVDAPAMAQNDVKVADSEFLVQSLILGALADI